MGRIYNKYRSAIALWYNFEHRQLTEKRTNKTTTNLCNNIQCEQMPVKPTPSGSQSVLVVLIIGCLPQKTHFLLSRHLFIFHAFDRGSSNSKKNIISIHITLSETSDFLFKQAGTAQDGALSKAQK